MHINSFREFKNTKIKSVPFSLISSITISFFLISLLLFLLAKFLDWQQCWGFHIKYQKERVIGSKIGWEEP